MTIFVFSYSAISLNPIYGRMFRENLQYYDFLL